MVNEEPVWSTSAYHEGVDHCKSAYLPFYHHSEQDNAASNMILLLSPRACIRLQMTALIHSFIRSFHSLKIIISKSPGICSYRFICGKCIFQKITNKKHPLSLRLSENTHFILCTTLCFPVILFSPAWDKKKKSPNTNSKQKPKTLIC